MVAGFPERIFYTSINSQESRNQGAVLLELNGRKYGFAYCERNEMYFTLNNKDVTLLENQMRKCKPQVFNLVSSKSRDLASMLAEVSKSALNTPSEDVTNIILSLYYLNTK